MIFGELQFMDFIKNRSTNTDLQNFTLAIFVVFFCLSLFIELLKPVLRNALKYFQNEAKVIHSKYYKHLREATHPSHRADKNGLGLGRLAQD